MKANENTVLIGENVILVPFLPHHVPKYYQWMCDEELLRLTESDPVTLEEVYEMQQMWLLDDEKLAFIILALDDANRLEILAPSTAHMSPTDPRIVQLPMVGDVNITLKGFIPHLDDHLQYKRPSEGDDLFEAEVGVMTAEPEYRRKGYALKTLKLLLCYVTGAPASYFTSEASSSDVPAISVKSPLNIPPACLVARIFASNTPSIRLFEKLGFKVTKRVEVFREVEMRWFHCLGRGV